MKHIQLPPDDPYRHYPRRRLPTALARLSRPPTDDGDPTSSVAGEEAGTKKAFTTGEREELAVLCQRYHPALTNVARRRGLRDPDMAATDSLIEAFICFDPQLGRFGPFVLRIHALRIIDYLRLQGRLFSRFVPVPDGFDPSDDDAADAPARAVTRAELREAIRGLSKQEQFLLQLVYEEELSLDEISRMF